ncbi:hypothetical protein DR64_4975 [Paraburkholderia xenovorans LB400]|nr:hypothetical protein DR64_4975 [Paraburkholderia xenovorans LB400]
MNPLTLFIFTAAVFAALDVWQSVRPESNAAWVRSLTTWGLRLVATRSRIGATSL